MSRFKTGYFLATVALIALSGCGKKEPTGQVVATLDGKEITAIDLSTEMQGFQAPNPQIRKQAERQALDTILARRAVAAAAKEAGIDKTPGYAQQKQRMEEVLLTQMWQEKIAKSVPAPSKEEVEGFIASHPNIYANRKIFNVSQIRTPRNNDPKLIADLRPLNNMESISSLLAERKVPFRAGEDRIDALAVDPDVIDQIMKLPPGEVFVVPSGNLLTINRIDSSTEVPVPQDVAMKHAEQYLKQKHTKEAIARQFQSVIAAAKKDVEYSQAYKPVAEPAGRPPAKAPASAKAVPATAPAPKGP